MVAPRLHAGGSASAASAVRQGASGGQLGGLIACSSHGQLGRGVDGPKRAHRSKCTSTPLPFRSVMAPPSILTADRGGVTSQAISHSAARSTASLFHFTPRQTTRPASSTAWSLAGGMQLAVAQAGAGRALDAGRRRRHCSERCCFGCAAATVL